MYDFVYIFRIIAALLITNSHYEAVYPHSIFANGGLLGNIMFFAISGYCLFPIRKRFGKWYARRITRIYPAVWIISLLYLALGWYQAGSAKEWLQLLVFPTEYHFVASIMLLYIVFYVLHLIMQRFPGHEDAVLFGSAAAAAMLYAGVYLFGYDRSYYHIDAVWEPMIRFLFFFAMCVGVYFKLHQEKYIGKKSAASWVLFVVSFAAYFASKLLFSRGTMNAGMQWLNQVLILAVLVFFFRGIIGMEPVFNRMKGRLRSSVLFVAGITFEIYLVQFALIPVVNRGPFPVNFLIVTAAIFLAATALHYLTNWVTTGVSRLTAGKNRAGK